jgi:hypothetical protein
MSEKWKKELAKEIIKDIEELQNSQSIKPLLKIISKGFWGKDAADYANSRRMAALSLKKISESDPEKIKLTKMFFISVQKFLYKQMKMKDSIARSYVVDILGNIGWHPRNSVEKIYYLIAKKKWQELAKNTLPNNLNAEIMEENSPVKSNLKILINS